MLGVLIPFTRGIEQVRRVLVIAWMGDYSSPDRVGVAVEHRFQHFVFILDFGRLGPVVSDFPLSTVPFVVSESKARVCVSHPISKGFYSGLEVTFLRRNHTTHFMCMISHQAVPVDLDEVFETVCVSVEEGG